MARRISNDIDVVENTGSPVEENTRGPVEEIAVVSEEKPKAAQESVYSVNELAANARKIFGTRQECVAAALKASGKTECTVSEAKKIVEIFLKKEVK